MGVLSLCTSPSEITYRMGRGVVLLLLVALTRSSCGAKLEGLEPSFAGAADSRLNEVLGGYLPPVKEEPAGDATCETTIVTETDVQIQTEAVPTTLYNDVVVTSTDISTIVD